MAELLLLGGLEAGAAGAAGFGLAEAGLAAGTAGIFGGAEAGLGAGLFAGSSLGGAGLGGLGAGLAGGIGAAEALGGFEAGFGGGFGEAGFGAGIGGVESGLAGTALDFGGLAGAEALGADFAGISGFGGAEALGGFEGALGGFEGGQLGGFSGALGNAGQIAATGAAVGPAEILAGTAFEGSALGGLEELAAGASFEGGLSGLGGAVGPEVSRFSLGQGFGFSQEGGAFGPFAGSDVASAVAPGEIEQANIAAGEASGKSVSAFGGTNRPLPGMPGSNVQLHTQFGEGDPFGGGFQSASSNPGVAFDADQTFTSGFHGEALPEGMQLAEGLSPGFQNFEGLQAQMQTFGGAGPQAGQQVLGSGFTSEVPVGGFEGGFGDLSQFEELGNRFSNVSGFGDSGVGGFETAVTPGGGPPTLASGFPETTPGLDLGGSADLGGRFAGGELNLDHLLPIDVTQTAGTNALAAAGSPVAQQAGGSIIPRTIGGIPTNMILPGAMLARTLIQGPADETPEAKRARELAQQTSQFSGTQLSDAQAGRLNPAQAAAIATFRQQAENMLYQQLARAGIDPRTSTQFQQGMAQIEQQAQAMQRQFIDQMFQQAFTAGGQSSSTLLALSQQTLGREQAFNNAIQSALQAIGLAAGGGAINLRLSTQ